VPEPAQALWQELVPELQAPSLVQTLWLIEFRPPMRRQAG